MLVAAIALGWSAVAHSRLSGTNYHGHTSQQRKISFRIVEDLSLRRLAYGIVDVCPGGKKLTHRLSGFPPMPMVRGHFGGTFYDHTHGAKAVISGAASNRLISGSLTDRTKNTRTHQLCNGRARFRVRLR